MADPSDSLSALLTPHARRCEQDLRAWLVEEGTPEALADAMRYVALDGGKRLRPTLVYLAAESCGGRAEQELVRRAAVAVELVHTYSLVHDDLPAMDDDALRRGRPTAHVQFGEAMAILTGDALLTRAFGVLAETGDPQSAKLVSILARGAGTAGMIAGQVADMELCDLPVGPDGVWYIHERKTAALIAAAVTMGATCAGASDVQRKAMAQYGRCLGLAFQLFDDLLDVTGSAADLGKTPGKDAQAGKRTGVAEMGLEELTRRGRLLTRQAIEALTPLDGRDGELRKLADLLTQRTH